MIAIGLLIIALGAFFQASSYVPINKVKDWSWENFWIIQGFFGWVMFPFFGALLSIPTGHSLWALYASDTKATLLTLFFGMLWGVGGLTFGLSMRYLGVALGQSLALGICSALGVILTPVATDLIGLSEGMVGTLTGAVLAGVAVSFIGILIIGLAGSMRAKSSQKEGEEQRFNFKKGIIVVLISGFMSACFSIGQGCGAKLFYPETSPVMQGMPAMLMVTIGGFIVNAVYCFRLNTRNKNWGDFAKGRLVLSNLAFCLLAGLLWTTQMFGLCLGRGFFRNSPTMLAFSWAILMTLNILFSNLWGILLKEWKGSSRKTILVLSLGLVILVVSIFLPEMLTRL